MSKQEVACHACAPGSKNDAQIIFSCLFYYKTNLSDSTQIKDDQT